MGGRNFFKESLEGKAMAENCALLVVLSAFAWTDIRKQEFPLFLLIAGGAAGAVLYFARRAYSPLTLLGGVCVGGMLLLGALLSGGRIGVGDGLLFCVTGLYLGLWGNLSLLFAASIFCAVAGLVLVATKRGTRKQSLPFAPFVLAADVALLVFGI